MDEKYKLTTSLESHGQELESHAATSGPAFSIKQKYKCAKTEENPPPNQYNPKYCFTAKEAPQFTVKERLPVEYVTQDEMNRPAPSEYEICYSQCEKSSPKFLLRSRQELMNERTEVPAPNAYFTSNSGFESAENNSPKFSFRSRPQSHISTIGPGPGEFKVQRPFSADTPAFSIKVRRSTTQEDSILGPGSYNITKQSSIRAPLFAGRTEIKNKDNYPGPAAYNVQLERGHSPMYSLAGRYNNNATSESPGPIYNVSTTVFSSNKGYTIKGKQLNRYENGVPGVGTYNAARGFERPVSATLFKGSNERFKDISTNVPGPGFYKVKDEKKSVCCYFGEKIQVREKLEEQPAPCDYHIAGRFDEIRRKNEKSKIEFTKEEVEEWKEKAAYELE